MNLTWKLGEETWGAPELLQFAMQTNLRSRPETSSFLHRIPSYRMALPHALRGSVGHPHAQRQFLLFLIQSDTCQQVISSVLQLSLVGIVF